MPARPAKFHKRTATRWPAHRPRCGCLPMCSSATASRTATCITGWKPTAMTSVNTIQLACAPPPKQRCLSAWAQARTPPPASLFVATPTFPALSVYPVQQAVTASPSSTPAALVCLLMTIRILSNTTLKPAARTPGTRWLNKLQLAGKLICAA